MIWKHRRTYEWVTCVPCWFVCYLNKYSYKSSMNEHFFSFITFSPLLCALASDWLINSCHLFTLIRWYKLHRRGKCKYQFVEPFFFFSLSFSPSFFHVVFTFSQWSLCRCLSLSLVSASCLQCKLTTRATRDYYSPNVLTELTVPLILDWELFSFE